jgi:hypothetical protein
MSWDDPYAQPPPQMVSAPGARGTEYVSTDDFDPNAAGGEDQFGRGITVAVGNAYVGGLFLGGAYGVRQGLVLSAHQAHLPKLRVNSVLNQVGRYGSRTANTVGVTGELSVWRRLFFGWCMFVFHG